MAPMVHRLLAAAAALLLLPLSAIATDIEYCDDTADYPVKVNSVQISYIPVVTGREVTFNVSATNTRDEISSGELNIFIACEGIKYGDVQDICNLTACPVAIGDFTLIFNEVLPGSCRLGIWIGPDDDMLTCFFVNFEPAFAS